MNNSKYFNEDCFDILPTIPDSSVDLIFCDLPYNSTNCKWDQSVIDLDKLWIEFKRIRKDTTPIVMTCTTKFGFELIKSNPKEFKFDMVWQKSRKCGFLQARKRPLCNHEMVYFFYKKQPKYNYLRYHTYSQKESSKTLDETNRNENGIYGDKLLKDRNVGYDPPLPASVIVKNNNSAYNNNTGQMRTINKDGSRPFVPIKNVSYDPPLPASVIEGGNLYTKHNIERRHDTYKPPLPASIQPFKSSKPSKHQTGKPLDLMEFILKYWTDEGDTVFDPTFGGGSMPIQCKKMNRNFIGCEMDKKFYDDAIKLIDKN